MLNPSQQEAVIRQWTENTGTSERAQFCVTEGDCYLSLRGVYSRDELREIVKLWDVAEND